MRALILPLFLSFIATASLAAPDCRELFDPTPVVHPLAEKNLKNYGATFTHDRSSQHYAVAVGVRYSTAIAKLQEKGGRWLDAGAGEAMAVREVLAKSPENVTATIVALETSVTPTDRLRVFKEFFEKIPGKVLGTFDLITDIFGVLPYSAAPDRILQKYVDHLSPDGDLLIFLGANHELFGRNNLVAGSDGRVRTLAEWILENPTIEAQIDAKAFEGEFGKQEKWSLHIKRIAGVEPFIPELVLEDFKPGAPPKMKFRERAAEEGLSAAQRMEMGRDLQLRARQALAHFDLTRFLDAFRRKELRNPLLAAVEKLKGNQLWINVSPFGEKLGEAWGSGYDRKRASPFSRWAQSWMGWRVDRVKGEDLRYVHVREDQSLPSGVKARVISDLFGKFLSDLEPGRTLQDYTDHLEVGGEIVIYLGNEKGGYGTASTVLREGRSAITLRDWLASLPGFEATWYRSGHYWDSAGEWTSVRLKKITPDVRVPDLVVTGVLPAEGDKIPGFLLREK